MTSGSPSVLPWLYHGLPDGAEGGQVGKRADGGRVQQPPGPTCLYPGHHAPACGHLSVCSVRDATSERARVVGTPMECIASLTRNSRTLDRSTALQGGAGLARAAAQRRRR
eukprot:gene12169-biopygen8426